jgi:hypothetical protein
MPTFIIIGDEIFGLSVSARWNSDIFQIWNMDSSLKESSTVMDKVTAILANVDSLKDVEIQSSFYKGNIYVRTGLLEPVNGCTRCSCVKCAVSLTLYSCRFVFIAHKDHDHFNK